MDDAPFTRDQMEAELREILAAQASHVAHVASDKAAREFIGFDWSFRPWDESLTKAAARIDLNRFNAADYLSKAYNYAFQVDNFHAYDNFVHGCLIAFDRSVPQYASSGLRVTYWLIPESKCHHVVDMAIARWRLDGNEHVSGLTIRELAVLGAMKEGAVRNSLSSEKIKTEGAPASVPVDVAREWLAKRKGFIPSLFADYRRETWQADARRLLEENFETGMANILARLELKPDAVAHKAGLPVDCVRQVLGGTHAADWIEALGKVGRALDLDAPHFVGKAVEFALRRSAAP